MEKYKSCPKCKSSDGYCYAMWTKYCQEINLQGEFVSAEHSDGKGSSLFECLSCHAKFRQKTLLIERDNNGK